MLKRRDHATSGTAHSRRGCRSAVEWASLVPARTLTTRRSGRGLLDLREEVDGEAEARAESQGICQG